MVLRSKPFLVIAASFFVLFHGDFASAQTKSGGKTRTGERTKPRAGAKPNASDQPKGTTQPAPPSSPKPIHVCVRPEGVDKTVPKWTYVQANKPVVTDVDSTAERFGNRIYVFDEKASLDSPALLPIPDNQRKCPNDDRKPPPEKPKAFAILPPSGATFESARPLGPSTAVLAPSSLSSSGTGKSPSILVDKFVHDAAQFQLSGNADKDQATRFAHTLSQSITAKTSVPEIAVGELTPDAAAILANTFGASLAAAMAHQPVIGPLNVLQKMVPAGKDRGWNVFALVNNQSMADKDIIAPDEVPAVMLSMADHQQRTSVVASLVPGPLPVTMLHLAYKQAYADKPAWLTSIAPYF